MTFVPIDKSKDVVYSSCKIAIAVMTNFSEMLIALSPLFLQDILVCQK